MVDNNYTAGGNPAPIDVKLFRWGFTDELFLDLYPGNSGYISENGAEIHSDVLINGQEVMARVKPVWCFGFGTGNPIAHILSR